MVDTAPPLIDFSPLSELYNTYRQGRRQREGEQALAQFAQSGSQFDPATRQLIAANPQLGMSLAQLALASKRDDRDFAARRSDATFSQGIQERQTKLAETQAQEKPQYMKDDSGNIIEILPYGKGAKAITPTGGAPQEAGGISIPPPPPGADSKEWKKFWTEDLAKAQSAMPGIEAKSAQAVKAINDIRGDPYRSWATGLTSMSGKIPGTPMFDFAQKVDQLKGKTFLEAFESLKGGGAISEVEGTKATSAIARLNAAQTEKGFLEALGDLEDVVKTGLETARQKARAGGAQGGPPKPQPTKVADPNAWKSKEVITAARANPQVAIAEAKAAIAGGKDSDMIKRRLRQVLGPEADLSGLSGL